MARAAGIAFLALLATPAFAAGDAFEGAPWWVAALAYGILVVLVAFLAAGLGYFLQGFLRLRSALISLTIVPAGLLAWVATVYGLEKAAVDVPLLLLSLTLIGSFFGLGWRVGVRDATHQSNRKLALNAGSNHG
ncbi:hypothetical protein JQ629_18760 [Bradyrhizobium sp. AUGA SZCCT0222]|uniref:hypothetical protein n=1 Tax=Bradyrhizobium sp. AUGA SZCCT0222 TaxID=2807668 RepID=UPI001BACF4F0|nr:hypothetical protein [Bradyrhizobium sp. AUGA SZCCT0222]MBR1269556.1 hypothetical protein [Bradyrhizobium sp. AUGA SZCCT0222]